MSARSRRAPCSARERGVLVLRQIRGAEVDRVQVDRRAALKRAHPVVAVVADVRQVDRHRPRQRALHARLPLPLRRHLRVVLEGDQLRDRQVVEPWTERLQLAVAQVRGGGDRRVAGDREDGVAVGTIVEEAAAAADDRGLVAVTS